MMMYKLQFVRVQIVHVLYERNLKIKKQYALHIHCVYKVYVDDDV